MKKLVLLITLLLPFMAAAQSNLIIENSSLKESIDLFIEECDRITNKDDEEEKASDIIFLYLYSLSNNCFIIRDNVSINNHRISAPDTLKASFRLILSRGFSIWNNKPVSLMPSFYFKYRNRYIFVYTGFEMLVNPSKEDQKKFVRFVKSEFKMHFRNSYTNSNYYLFSWVFRVDELLPGKIRIERKEYGP